MTLDKPGQTFGYCKKTFAVGGTVWLCDPDRGTDFLTVKLIYTCTDSVSGPSALCEYPDGRSVRLDLSLLEPVAARTTEQSGQTYALHIYCDGADGCWTKVLGVSDDRSVLLRLMLDDCKDNPPAELINAYRNESLDSYHFIYENTEKADALYVEYAIEPVSVFPRPKGGDTE